MINTLMDGVRLSTTSISLQARDRSIESTHARSGLLIKLEQRLMEPSFSQLVAKKFMSPILSLHMIRFLTIHSMKVESLRANPPWSKKMGLPPRSHMQIALNSKLKLMKLIKLAPFQKNQGLGLSTF